MNLIPRIRQTIFAAAAVLVASATAAQALNIPCTGTITQTWMNDNGTFFVLPSWFVGQLALVCNVNQTTITTNGSISPAACWSYYAMATTAQMNNKTVYFYYNNVPTGTTCSTTWAFYPAAVQMVN